MQQSAAWRIRRPPSVRQRHTPLGTTAETSTLPPAGRDDVDGRGRDGREERVAQRTEGAEEGAEDDNLLLCT